MWLLDWLMRLYELRAPLDASIKSLGNGWCCLTVPLPRRRLDGCACTSPIAHFYIYHSDSSIRELHPFTTTTHLASQNTITHPVEDDIRIQFLFRTRSPRKTSPSTVPTVVKPSFASPLFTALWKFMRQKQGSQWTERLAEFASQDTVIQDSALTPPTVDISSQNMPPVQYKIVPVSLRLEGPYFTVADPARYKTVVCIVAGTGISGALAIAGAFKELERQSTAAINAETTNNRPRGSIGNQMAVSPENTQAGSIVHFETGTDRMWTRCIVVWSVREDQYIDLPELKGSQPSGLEIRIHLTGNGRERLSVKDALDDILNASRDESFCPAPPSTWVYISGPIAFIEDVEVACKTRQEKGVEWYGAR